MDQRNQNERLGRESDPQDAGNTSDLQKFDFGDILTDDLPSSEPMLYDDMYEEEDRKTGQKPAGKSSDGQSQKGSPKQDNGRLRKIRRRRNGWKISVGVLTWIKDALIVLLVIWAMNTFLASFVTVPDSYMEPTMKAGEHMVVIKFSYHWTDPERGDVIAFKNHGDKTVISRVIGLPGDVIDINDEGSITLNGKLFTAKYCDGKTTYIPNQISYPYTVPEDSYFVLCDNPAATTDSRYLSTGAVSKSEIIGKIFGCFWPRDSWRPIN